MPKEKLLPLVDAVEEATGRRPHLSTCIRWCSRGRRGIRLSSIVLGGRRLTTISHVEHFIELVTAASVSGIATNVETPAESDRRVRKAAQCSPSQ